MIKLGNVSNLSGIKISRKVINVIEEQLSILDDIYRVQRDIENDLRGYVLILEDEKDVTVVKENILKDIIPEYTDNIECEGGNIYCLSLLLLSSDLGTLGILK